MEPFMMQEIIRLGPGFPRTPGLCDVADGLKH